MKAENFGITSLSEPPKSRTEFETLWLQFVVSLEVFARRFPKRSLGIDRTQAVQ
jgi:hypothetical protein